jgi:hypothetical protein
VAGAAALGRAAAGGKLKMLLVSADCATLIVRSAGALEAAGVGAGAGGTGKVGLGVLRLGGGREGTGGEGRGGGGAEGRGGGVRELANGADSGTLSIGLAAGLRVGELSMRVCWAANPVLALAVLSAAPGVNKYGTFCCALLFLLA